MKVLWIVNKTVGKIAEILNGVSGGFGGWIEKTMDEIAGSAIELSVLTSGEVSEIVEKTLDGITYYVIPGGDAFSSFRYDNSKGIWAIEQVLSRNRPDVIHLFGTESELALAVTKASAGIPKVVFMQGVMRAIQRSSYESTSKCYLRNNYTIRDVLKGRFVSRKARLTARKRQCEEQVLKHVDAVICDSNWCEAMCKAANPNLKVYRQNLPIDDVFTKTVWKGQTENHTLFCASQYDTFKGFETILRALEIVKWRFPDVKLCIPGGWNPDPRTMRQKLHYDTYSKAMNNLIAKLDLKDSVINIGSLSRAEMATNMGQAAVFVQASTAENHSSTMREAMFVGMPCVVSDVGSVPEYTVHGDTGFIYKDTDFETLAFYVIKLLENNGLSRQIGENAKRHIRERYESNDSIPTLQIYRLLTEKGTKPE